MERCVGSPVDRSSPHGSVWSSSSEQEDVEEEEVTSSSASSLHDMSDLMAALPIKKGLSKHYEGKSQSFASLACVSCLEDLPKREKRIARKKPAREGIGGERRRLSAVSCCSKIMKRKKEKGFDCRSPLPRRRLQEFRATDHPPLRSQSFPINGQTLLFA